MGTGIFVHHRKVLAFKRVEFVSDRLLYIVRTGRYFNIVILNLHAPSKEKSYNSKDRFCENLEQVFFIIFLSTV